MDDEEERGYLAITNKRYLLAEVDGVYSFTKAKIYNTAKYLLIGFTVEGILVTILPLITEPLMLVFLPFTRWRWFQMFYHDLG